MEEVDEVELVMQRVAALDLGKATLEACLRVPHPSKPGRRMQEIRGYATTTAALLEMAIWLRQWGIERVVMEATRLEGRLLPVGPRGWTAGWSTPARSRTCRGGPRRIALMRCGWQGWPNAACAARRWWGRRRSAGYAI